MQIRPAEINSDGIDRLLRYGEKPSLMGAGDETVYQRYIQGISVPDHMGLERPFNVPIRGDEESVSLTVDWPRYSTNNLFKRVTFSGVIPPEEITVGIPNNQDGDRGSDLLQDTFDGLIDTWGGILHATASISISDTAPGRCPALDVKTGNATFIVFESADEHEEVMDLLHTGTANTAEVVAAIMPSPAAAQLSNLALRMS